MRNWISFLFLALVHVAIGQGELQRTYDQSLLHGTRQPNGRHIFTGQTLPGEPPNHVISVDSLGEVLWARQFTNSDQVNEPTEGVAGANGNIIVAITRWTPDGTGPVILSLDENGGVAWAEELLLVGSHTVRSLARTSDGSNLLMVGGGSGYSPPTTIVKFHDDGSVLWAFRSDELVFWSAIPMSNGDVLLLGDALALLDPNGSVQWVTTLTAFGQFPVDAAEAPNGNMVIMSGNYAAQGEDEFMVFTIDHQGQILGGRSFATGGPIGNTLNEGDVIVLPDGRIAVLARTLVPVCHMLLLDPDHSTIWAADYLEYPMSIHWELGEGDEAWFYTTLPGGPGSLRRLQLDEGAPTGNCFGWVDLGTGFDGYGLALTTLTLVPITVATTAYPLLTTAMQINSLPEYCLFTGMSSSREIVRSLHPNPATDHTFLLGTAPASQWTLFDGSGRSLRQGVLEADGRIDLSGIATGLYVMKVRSNGVDHTERLVVASIR